jgi:MscS family membrane protein
MQELKDILELSYFGNTVLQWSLSFGIFLIFTFLRSLLAKFLVASLHKLSKKTKNTLDDAIISAIEPPLRLFLVIIGFYLMLVVLHLPDDFEVFIGHFFHSIHAFTIFWALYRITNIFSSFVSEHQGKISTRFSVDLALFFVKGVKLILIVMGFVVVVQEWGYDFTGFLASLGLGGLAFALAAKDTAANLFGSLVIFSDKPFDVGDWIQTPHVEGTVENIGIRSTRIRTFAKALVAVPNATLANSPITNWSQMTMRRIKMTVGLTYDTNSTQMQNILTQIRQMLNDDPDIDNKTILINFTDFQDSALGVFCYFFTKTTNWQEYLMVRERMNLNIMKIVEDNKAGFAFPSQSLYIETMPDNVTQGAEV